LHRWSDTLRLASKGAATGEERTCHPVIDPDGDEAVEDEPYVEDTAEPHVNQKFWRGWRCSYTKQDNINEERMKARRHLGKLSRGLADAIQKKSKALAKATMSRPWADKLNSKVKQKLKSQASAKRVALFFKAKRLAHQE
jgi:hypothetical protein